MPLVVASLQENVIRHVDMPHSVKVHVELQEFTEWTTQPAVQYR
jgi:hypothetical protein